MDISPDTALAVLEQLDLTSALNYMRTCKTLYYYRSVNYIWKAILTKNYICELKLPTSFNTYYKYIKHIHLKNRWLLKRASSYTIDTDITVKSIRSIKSSCPGIRDYDLIFLSGGHKFIYTSYGLIAFVPSGRGLVAWLTENLTLTKFPPAYWEQIPDMYLPFDTSPYIDQMVTNLVKQVKYYHTSFISSHIKYNVVIVFDVVLYDDVWHKSVEPFDFLNTLNYQCYSEKFKTDLCGYDPNTTLFAVVG